MDDVEYKINIFWIFWHHQWGQLAIKVPYQEVH